MLLVDTHAEGTRGGVENNHMKNIHHVQNETSNSSMIETPPIRGNHIHNSSTTGTFHIQWIAVCCNPQSIL